MSKSPNIAFEADAVRQHMFPVVSVPRAAQRGVVRKYSVNVIRASGIGLAKPLSRIGVLTFSVRAGASGSLHLAVAW